jgi:hypothetical protein
VIFFLKFAACFFCDEELEFRQLIDGREISISSLLAGSGGWIGKLVCCGKAGDFANER